MDALGGGVAAKPTLNRQSLTPPSLPHSSRSYFYHRAVVDSDSEDEKPKKAAPAPAPAAKKPVAADSSDDDVPVKKAAPAPAAKK